MSSKYSPRGLLRGADRTESLYHVLYNTAHTKEPEESPYGVPPEISCKKIHAKPEIKINVDDDEGVPTIKQHWLNVSSCWELAFIKSTDADQARI